MLRRIDRYVLRTFLGPLVWSAVGLPGLFLIVDAFEKMDDFREFYVAGRAAGAPAGAFVAEIGRYYAGFLMMNAAGYASVIALVAAVLCVSALARSNELVAVRSAGLSLRRTLAPLLAAALALAALQALAREVLVPPLARRARLAHTRVFDEKDAAAAGGRDRLRVLAPDGRELWSGRGNADLEAAHFRRRDGAAELEGLTLNVLTPDRWALVKAERAAWRGECWELESGSFKDKGGGGPAGKLYTTLTPDALEAEQGPMGLGLAALTAGRLARLSQRDACAVELAKRVALPLATVIALLVGLPVVLKRGAEGRARRIVSVAIALGLGLAYVAASELGAAAGAKGRLEPWLAVALPHAAFLALGAALYARMDHH